MTRVRSAGTGKKKPWAFMSKFVIYGNDSSVYLTRWRLIQTPWGGIFLHRFYRGDTDPYVHDHPWTFVSFILRGGYTEVRRNNFTHKLEERHVRFFNLMRRDDAHYIKALDRNPTWSLMFVGKRRRTWGFYVPRDGHTGVPTQTWIEFENWVL